MACRFEITLPGEDARHVAAARQALDEVEAIEEQISAFRSTSALARLNRYAAISPVIVDRGLLHLLSLCRAVHDDTERAFDITSTPLSRCWGFMQRDPCPPEHRRQRARIPSDGEISSALDAVGMEHVEIDAERHSVRFARKGLAINFGAVGKGWALDRVATGLRARGVGRALLSAGRSSVLAVGGRARAWQIDLISPRVTRRLACVELRYGSLGTSGAGEQFMEIDGRRYGHVLDPRTGRPTDSGLLSVSVLTAEAGLSDALSTAFLVGGIDLVHRYCARHSGVMAIVTREDDPATTRVIGEFAGANVILNEATT